MHPTRKRRMIGLLVILIGVGLASAVTIYSLRQNMLFFVSPSDIGEQDLPMGREFRLGGLVEPGSVRRAANGLAVRFTVTDGVAAVTVDYDGILPDLFREGQGVIARGQLQTRELFVAREVLAKHDENYMPPEVAEALEEKGMHNKSGQGADG
ncbi:MAG: cytochrome c maturation protein CcmE [Xanthomonadales bacterium]|nr:cytochrome c maturation protein CcmE [Xanthomonadales bacterium]NIT46228.1 cytochrome c maturation protein CcmE [Stutzerimonas stutzeri]NIN59908.1 cytochrome c maturation protein CcmE [Xanthomonadales bacterium]NIN75282.1 cytochrome c maturation protein CcmE [Xanthomonadales bacterium]NIO15151.1 cytochrome c maturation protein CcmE [Xanthomonadales bacterium]